MLRAVLELIEKLRGDHPLEADSGRRLKPAATLG